MARAAGTAAHDITRSLRSATHDRHRARIRDAPRQVLRAFAASTSPPPACDGASGSDYVGARCAVPKTAPLGSAPHRCTRAPALGLDAKAVELGLVAACVVRVSRVTRRRQSCVSQVHMDQRACRALDVDRTYPRRLLGTGCRIKLRSVRSQAQRVRASSSRSAASRRRRTRRWRWPPARTRSA